MTAPTSTAPTIEQCRISVFGPSGRVDLAVPLTTTVGALLPTLVDAVVRDEHRSTEDEQYGSWVLQRLGEPAMDPDGTPETLEWIDGERFELAKAENPLPELDYDDLADGMAAAVSRRPNRWTEPVNRRFFLCLTVAALAVAALALFTGTSATVAALTSAGLAALLLAASILVARTIEDSTLAGISGFCGAVFAGLATQLGVEGPAGTLALRPHGVLIGASTVLVVASGMLGLQRTQAKKLPILPFGLLAVAALGAIIGMWLHLGIGLNPHQNAAVVLSLAFGILLFAPKLATRAARLRGPQLPKRSEEMKIDIDPARAAEVEERTGHADDYLSVLAIGSAPVFVIGFGHLLGGGIGWHEYTIAGLLTALVLLRSREFRNVGQRVAIGVAGASGATLFVLTIMTTFHWVWQVLTILGLVFVALWLALAALRPLHRRLLPLWMHLGNIAEMIGAIALVPMLLVILRIFAWARGLAG